IKLSPEHEQANEPLLLARAPLILEGLELRRVSQDGDVFRKAIVLGQNALRVVNCRFLTSSKNQTCIRTGPICDVRNCEFLGSGTAAIAGETYRVTLVFDNCLHAGGPVVDTASNTKELIVQLFRNTWGPTQSRLVRVLITAELLKVEDANQQ